MKKQLLFIFVLFWFSVLLEAQQVTIKGNAKSYAGDELIWNCYDDQITFEEKELANAIVDKNGDFVFKINLNETILSFIHLNVFKGLLYLEPGKEYEIVLPQKVNKLPEDELNPFFEETEFNIRILNADENELNELIKSFNRLYDNCLTKYFQQFRGKLSKSIADSIVESIDKAIPEKKNSYFNEYKLYSYASLRLMAYERNKEKLTENYFSNKPILYQNPAYMDLFNQLYSNYLSYYSKSKQGKHIPLFLIKDKSLKKIKSALNETPALQCDTFQDLIICKSLFDNFYKEDFPQESITFMLDSLKLVASKENKKIANNIYKRITTLLPGYTAPDFQLPDFENKIHSLSQSRNKFVYLSFINPKSYTCLQELEVLKKMASKNLEMLEIVSICVCDNIEEMQKLVKDNGYNWPILYFSKNKDLLKAYNLRVFPTYYLINPESKLAMSPAFPPTEASFEDRYSDILKAWKIEIEQRKTKGKGTNK